MRTRITVKSEDGDNIEKLEAIYRRIDWRLLPFLLLCYVLACLDRYNISFAKFQMQQALGMDEAVYGFGAGIFFLGYMLFEVPSNLILERIGARKTISRIMVLWGVTSASMLFVHNSTSFYVLRFLLGVFEAGFAPGMIFYLTYWYPDTRRARVMSIVLMGGPLAGLLGGPLASLIMGALDQARGLAGWQWLFVVEGLPCILLGAVTIFYLADTPAQATWLSKDDRAALANDIQAVRPRTRHHSLGAVVKDPWFYMLAFGYFCLICGVYTVSFWLPTMLKSSGVSNGALGWYAGIPYLATVLLVPVLARHSDRTGERRLHSGIPAILGACLVLLASTFEHDLIRTLLCMSGATVSIYVAYVVFWSIPTAYLKATAAAGGIALLNTIGLFGGFVSPFLIGWLKNTTGSIQSGLYVMSAILFFGALSILCNRAATIMIRRSDTVSTSA
ncbi:MFS transporter [Paraburkholderia sp. RL17-347-BIC-D]|uniref:MFS transporter n=1 Tax=Paraburkholderia sp. RL17-347-BIC-D TaxID=3031632 RepID=UPI0038BB139F